MYFPNDIMAALGRFIVRWSDFEYRLGIAFAKALGGVPIQKAMLIFHSGGGFATRRDLLKAIIADTGFTKPQQELLELLSEAEAIASVRNDLAHGNWKRYSDGHATIGVFKPRSADRSYLFDITAGQLDAYCEEIDDLITRLENLDLTPTSRARHRSKDASD